MNRIEKLRKELGAGFGAALVLDHYNRRYLTEFGSSDGIVLVTEKQAWFIADSRYCEAARAKSRGVDVVLMDMTDSYGQAAGLLSADVDTLYVEQTISIAMLDKVRAKFGGCQLVTDSTLTEALSRLRAIKEPGEVEHIKAAQAITDAAFSHILGFIEPGKTEREVAAELEHFMRLNGADGLAFSTICVAGVKSSMPHGEPDENVIRKGDFVTMDYGAFKDGYCSDMTRTVAVGEIDGDMKRVYATVLEAHLAAAEAARAGMTGAELDKVARDIIYDAGYEGSFGHGLGHSLGLEVHENPRASFLYKETLPAGTIMTIEPGIYLEGRFGVRIENMVLIGADGSENLSASDRALIVL